MKKEQQVYVLVLEQLILRWLYFSWFPYRFRSRPVYVVQYVICTQKHNLGRHPLWKWGAVQGYVIYIVSLCLPTFRPSICVLICQFWFLCSLNWHFADIVFENRTTYNQLFRT